jgi:hypothetical protein
MMIPIPASVQSSAEYSLAPHAPELNECPAASFGIEKFPAEKVGGTALIFLHSYRSS